MATLGGLHEIQSGPQNCNMEGMDDALAKFAVDEHNRKEDAQLEFSRLVKKEEQVVAGTLHHLTIETIDAGKKKLYLAKVWVKPWLNFKELQEFKLHDSQHPKVEEEASGAGKEDEGQNDKEIHGAALHAVKTIQQRSNSLDLYKLEEISHLESKEVDGGATELAMHLKLRRGTKEERFKALVTKKDGTYILNQLMTNSDPGGA